MLKQHGMHYKLQDQVWENNQFYQELLELGVVNSNVQLKQVADILADADFGGILNKVNGDWGLNKL